MRSFFATLTLFFCVPVASASTFHFDLLFEKDHVLELQAGLGIDSSCNYFEACYPDNFRLPNGYFAGLEPGELTSAWVDLDAGMAEIAGWMVPGELIQSTALASFFSVSPTSLTKFATDRVTVSGEGPSGRNPSGFCDPDHPAAGMPDGYCGFFGYEASFEVLNVTEVPIPTAALMLLSGLVFLGVVTRRQTRRQY